MKIVDHLESEKVVSADEAKLMKSGAFAAGCPASAEYERRTVRRHIAKHDPCFGQTPPKRLRHADG